MFFNRQLSFQLTSLKKFACPVLLKQKSQFQYRRLFKLHRFIKIRHRLAEDQMSVIKRKKCRRTCLCPINGTRTTWLKTAMSFIWTLQRKKQCLDASWWDFPHSVISSLWNRCQRHFIIDSTSCEMCLTMQKLPCKVFQNVMAHHSGSPISLITVLSCRRDIE